MRKISTTTFPALQAWWEKAYNTPHVYRFLSIGNYHPEFTTDGLGWGKIYLLSDDQATAVIMEIDRYAKPEITVGIWSLHSNRMRRAIGAGQALKATFKITQELGARTILTTVLSTNKESLYLCNKRFGPPWGIQPKMGWDSYLAEYVDLHKFQKLLP